MVTVAVATWEFQARQATDDQPARRQAQVPWGTEAALVAAPALVAEAAGIVLVAGVGEQRSLVVRRRCQVAAAAVMTCLKVRHQRVAKVRHRHQEAV